MKISYNWLKTLINTDLTPEQMDEYLTSSGLEVEGIEPFETIKGGLKGLVIGEVVTKEKHPVKGEIIISLIKLRPTYSITDSELKERLLLMLPAIKVPDRIEFITSFNYTSTGKKIKP